jgi:hypothetical protein
MRTKTLLLSGVVAALSGASMMAQVYSLNVVGYVNVTIPSGDFAMVADQLWFTPGSHNYLSPMLDSQLIGSQSNPGAGITFYPYTTAGGFAPVSVSATGTGYSSAVIAENTELDPGQGFFVFNPQPNPFTITFVGTVPQGTLVNTNAVAAGFSMISSMVPQAGTLDTNATTGLSFTPNNGDIIYSYDPVNGYSAATANYNTGQLGYSTDPNPRPYVAVGQGFFYSTGNADGLTWTRTFNVQ